jgi:hypothetical protein
MLTAFLAHFMHLCSWCRTRQSSPSVVIIDIDEYERIETNNRRDFTYTVVIRQRWENCRDIIYRYTKI